MHIEELSDKLLFGYLITNFIIIKAIIIATNYY